MWFDIWVRVEIVCGFERGATMRNNAVWYSGTGGDSLWSNSVLPTVQESGIQIQDGGNNAKQYGLIFGYGGRYFVAQQCSPNSTGIWNTNWTCNLPLRKRTTYQEFQKVPGHTSTRAFLLKISKISQSCELEKRMNLNENWVLGLLKKTSWLNVQAAGGESLWF